MKKIDIKINKEKVSNVVQKTADISKKAFEGAQKGVKTLQEKSKEESYLRRLKKYNPLFVEDYNNALFNKPNMIVIVDDAVRRGIDVCEGSIGWLNKENGMEVLYMYDEFVEESGIQFIPTANCDSVYYVDSFDRNKFIKLEHIFIKSHEERLAELKHIAYSLGAKRCSIEITESTREVKSDNKIFELNESFGFFANSNESASQSLSKSDSNRRSGKIEVQFEGNDTPKVPELKWFAHDENIKRLIEMRCQSNNSIKNEVLELSGTSSATMSQKMAYAIDGAVKSIGASGDSTMESQAQRENQSKLIYKIEF